MTVLKIGRTLRAFFDSVLSSQNVPYIFALATRLKKVKDRLGDERSRVTLHKHSCAEGARVYTLLARSVNFLSESILRQRELQSPTTTITLAFPQLFIRPSKAKRNKRGLVFAI